MELLSPAGSFDKMKYAIHYGADAVYLGVRQLSLRVKENEFTLDNIKDAVKYAHDYGVKVYITTNIYLRGNQENTIKYLESLYEAEADAFIVSDPGMILLIKENFDIPLHLSVQANTTNKYAAKFWYKQRIERIILARELSIEEVKEIHNFVPNLELEFFVHGSICMAYSGRCLLSAYLSKRNPNLGVCAQPCRWEYRVFVQEKKSGNLLEVDEDEHGTYIFNSKDLCLIEHLDELIKAGITSFKIEGRNKIEYYVARVTRAYRIALDLIKEGKIPPYEELIEELKKAPNRGFITSYIDMPITTIEKDLQNIHSSLSQQTHMYLGKIVGSYKDYLTIEVKNKISVGDVVEILTPHNIYNSKVVEIIVNGISTESAHPGQKNVKVKLDRLPRTNYQYALLSKPIDSKS